MSGADAAVAFARSNASRFERTLARFVGYPSVSGQPARATNVRDCATWLAGQLREIGLERVARHATPLHPIVTAQWRRRPGAPTVLVYGHYDVQPADPLDAWTSPPFTPTRQGEHLVGRGASDDKGQLLAHVAALEAFLRTSGWLPVNVVCVFEGEEEIGSPNLGRFLLTHHESLRADAAVVSDMTMLGPTRPALTYSVRGNLGLELESRGPRHDLHSGNFGGAVLNPLEAMCAVVDSLHDDSGRVAVAGFYDRVAPLAATERRFMADSGPSDSDFLAAAGAEAGAGEPGYTLYERATARPALTVTGVSGGYTGAGSKAVLPAHSLARLDLRLVPSQRPEEIERLVRRHVEARTPPGARFRVRRLAATRPAVIDPEHWTMRAAAWAYQRAFGAPPALIRCGGTVPVIGMLHDELAVPTVPMGFALPDDRAHAPNERVHLPTLGRAAEASIWFLDALARVAPSTPAPVTPSSSRRAPASSAPRRTVAVPPR